MARIIRIAAAQTKSLPTVRETLQALETIAEDAARQQVGLVLFPEAYLGGYPRTCNFGASVGARSEYGRDQFREYFKAAVDLGDTFAGAGNEWHQRKLKPPQGSEYRGDGTREVLERIARSTGVFLAVGIVEKAGSSLFCGMVFVSPEQGMLPEKRRKVMPTGTERLVWSQGDTSTLKAFTTSIQGVPVVIGSAICWENYMPLLRHSLYMQNVNLWLAPTADGRPTWLPLLQTIACEGRTFVINCNQVVRTSDLPSWVQPDAAQKISVRRQSSVSSTVSNALSRTRSSISKTKEGHEICWPGTEFGCEGSQHDDEPLASIVDVQKRNSITSTMARRRSTVSTREGHEICLPVSRPQSDEELKQDDSLSGVHRSEEDSLSIARARESQSGGEAFVSHGGSCIVNPFGVVVKDPSWQSEGLIIADIDLDECTRGKFDFDVAGHYSRNDAFRLTVSGLELAPP